MRLLNALLILCILPLAGCAGAGAPADVPREFEDLPQNYIIFFAVDSAELDEMAQGVIAEAAQDGLQYQPMMIEIAGFSGGGADTPVSAELAAQRFSAVEEALAAEGLEPSLMTRSLREADPNLPDLALHRFEIIFQLP